MLATAASSFPTDRLGSVLALLSNARRSGKGFVAPCPAHDDRSPSLSIAQGEGGNVLLHCHAGCSIEAVTAALGITVRDLCADRTPVSSTDYGRGVSLDAIALRTQLPRVLFEQLGWKESHYYGTPCVDIPYQTRGGLNGRVHVRRAASGKNRFVWRDGGEIVAYEPDSGRLAKQLGFVVICEGETDVATLVHAGMPALGVPGSSFSRVVASEHLAGLHRVFIVRETDSGGDAFAAGLQSRAKELGFGGGVHVIAMPGGAKDVNELWKRDPGVDAFTSQLRKAMQEAVHGPVPAYRMLSEAARTLRPIRTRLTSGFPGLDEAFRGGVPLGSLVMVNGGPGSSKTALSTWLTDRWEREGCGVVYYAADQHADGIVLRLGQIAGLDRADLERLGPQGDDARAEFALRSQGRRICVFDPNAGAAPGTLEEAETVLRDMAEGRPPVLIVDSLQMARCAASLAADSPRERVDAVVHKLVGLARRGVTVIALSEANRTAYRQGSRQLDASGISSGKESSSIEFQGDAVIMLRPVKGEPDLFDVELAKNSRFGQGNPDLRLHLDRQRHRFTEVAVPGEGQPRSDAHKKSLDADAHSLLRLLLATPDLSERGLREQAKAQLSWGVERLGAARAHLERGVGGYRAVNRGSTAKAKWRAEPYGVDA